MRNYALDRLSMQSDASGAPRPGMPGASCCQGPAVQGMMIAREGRPPMRGHSRAVAAGVLAVLAASAVAGCGATPGKQHTTAAGGTGPSAGPSAGSVTGTRCGTVRTAAGVPVDVEVVGQVACHDAMTVERDYTRALGSGK